MIVTVFDFFLQNNYNYVCKMTKCNYSTSFNFSMLFVAGENLPLVIILYCDAL